MNQDFMQMGLYFTVVGAFTYAYGYVMDYLTPKIHFVTIAHSVKEGKWLNKENTSPEE